MLTVYGIFGNKWESRIYLFCHLLLIDVIILNYYQDNELIILLLRILGMHYSDVFCWGWGRDLYLNQYHPFLLIMPLSGVSLEIFSFNGTNETETAKGKTKTQTNKREQKNPPKNKGEQAKYELSHILKYPYPIIHIEKVQVFNFTLSSWWNISISLG